MPHLKALVKRYEGQPFVIVGVNCDDSEEVFRKGVEEYGVTWINAFHGKGMNPIAMQWGVNAFPTMHIIDQDGNIAALDVRGQRIEQIVDKLLAKDAQSE